MINQILLMICSLISYAAAITIAELEERQIKTSYGFQVLRYYHQDDFGRAQEKSFKGEVLVHYLPWRAKERAVPFLQKYIKKIDYFIPAFYQLEKQYHDVQTKGQLKLHKSSEDFQLVKRLKQKHGNLKVLPRVHVSGFQGDVLVDAYSDQQKMKVFLGFFDQILQNSLYDGVVFESNFLTPNINQKYPFRMKQIVKYIRRRVLSHKKLLFLSLEGVDDPSDRIVNKKAAKDLIQYADKFLIQCYQYPKQVSGRIMPLSPFKWMLQNIDLYQQIVGPTELKLKAIIVLPLFGNSISLIGKYDPIMGHQMIPRLSEDKSNWMEWDDNDKECAIAQNKYQFLMFPCLNFFKARYKQLQSRGLNLGLFEIGSGLQIFLQQL